MRKIKIGKFTFGDTLALISGPCVIESEDKALFSAEYLKNLCERLDVPLIYKSSYDKANRLSFSSFRGPGIDQGLSILEKVKKEFDLPILTDVHTPLEALAAAQVCDVLQIPAFLCRQTDLLLAAAQTGKAINIKKGQFMAPWDMKSVADKVLSTGNSSIILTDRGTCFGYNNLVSDMRSIPIMQQLGYPVCFDATHSVQIPGGHGTSSGGQREFIGTLSKAAVAAGCDYIFIESHPNPAEAKSDKDSQLPLHELEDLLRVLKKIYRAVHAEEVAPV